MRFAFLMIMFVIATPLCLLAQKKVFTYQQGLDENILEFSETPDHEKVFILSEIKSQGGKATRYQLFDSDFETLQDYHTDNRYDEDEIIFQTSSGDVNLVALKNGLALLNGEDTTENTGLFAQEDYNENINQYATNPVFLGENKDDLPPINFLTEKNFVSIGRLEGKEHFKDGDFSEMDIYMYLKPLDGGRASYIPVEVPDGAYFSKHSPKLHYYDEEKFIVIFNITRNNKKHTYRPVYYDYNGKILHKINVTLEVPEGVGEFGILNLDSSSFNSWVRQNRHGRNANIIPYQFATASSQAGLIYDHYSDSFFLYGSVNNKGEDDALLLTRYNHKGEQLWYSYQPVVNSNFKYLNSANRYLTIIPSSEFIGLRMYSTKGKHYNNVHLFDKETGEVIKEKYYSNKEYKRSNLFNTYCAMMGAYDPSFIKFLKDFDFSREEKIFDRGYFVEDGFLAITRSKKEDQFTVYKFLFKSPSSN